MLRTSIFILLLGFTIATPSLLTIQNLADHPIDCLWVNSHENNVVPLLNEIAHGQTDGVCTVYIVVICDTFLKT